MDGKCSKKQFLISYFLSGTNKNSKENADITMNIYICICVCVSIEENIEHI